MKNIIRLLSLLFILTLSSCGSESVNVDKIKTACDCADAYEKIINDLIDTKGDMSFEEIEQDPEVRESLEAKFKKFKEVEYKCDKELKIEMAEIVECNDDLQEAMDKLEENF